MTTAAFKFVSVTRSGSAVYLHMDGAIDATVGTVSGALNNCPAALGIGVLDVAITPLYRLNGFIGPVRLTRAARYYNASYTPPTAVFPNP